MGRRTRKRDEGGLAAVIVMGLFLNSLGRPIAINAANPPWQAFPERAFRYTVGAGSCSSSLNGPYENAGPYAPYFGALVPLRFHRAGACP